MEPINKYEVERNAVRKKNNKNTIFYLLAVYYCLTYIFHFFKIQSVLKDILITPLFFLVPAGIGLLFFSIGRIHIKILNFLTNIQLVLSSTFLGFLFISLIYVKLNNTSQLSSTFNLLYPSINILSFLGFYAAREIFLPAKSAGNHLKNIFFSLPVFLMLYYFNFFHFSSYPLRDIFMEVHFMKGALELSKYQILNFATADSYFPLFQVHLGNLNNFFNYDLFNSHWIMPVYLFLFQYFCYYCFFASFIKNEKTLTAACVLSFASTSLMFSTNYGYLYLLSLVVFSVLASKNANSKEIRPLIIELVIFILISIVFYKNRNIPAAGETPLNFIAGVMILFLLTFIFNIKKVFSTAFVILLLFIAQPYHKAASVYIPLIIVMYGFYLIAFQSSIFERLRKNIGIVFLSAMIFIFMLILSFRFLPFLGDFLLYLYLFMDGDGGYSPAGITTIILEWLRTIPPSVYLFFLFFTVSVFFVYKNKTNLVRTLIYADSKFIIFASLALAISIVIVFMPIPHLYRFHIYSSLFVSALFAFLYRIYDKTCKSNSHYFFMKIKLPLFAVACLIFLKMVYSFPWMNGEIKNYYLSLLSPIPEVIIAGIVLLTALLMFNLKKQFFYGIAFTILLSCITLDRLMLTAKLYEKCYPYKGQAQKVIAHYSLLELNAAKKLSDIIDYPKNNPGFLMISDPYTLAIFKAATGINGLYSFSNIGMMKKEYEENMKFIVRTAFPDLNYNAHVQGINSDRKTDQLLRLLEKYINENKGAVPEAEYIIQTKLRQQFNPFFFSDKIVWIVCEKTVKWAYGSVGYYPENGQFRNEYIKNYILPFYEVLYNADNRILILRSK